MIVFQLILKMLPDIRKWNNFKIYIFKKKIVHFLENINVETNGLGNISLNLKLE